MSIVKVVDRSQVEARKAMKDVLTAIAYKLGCDQNVIVMKLFY